MFSATNNLSIRILPDGAAAQIAAARAAPFEYEYG